jgi:glutamyl-tRNA reductase
MNLLCVGLNHQSAPVELLEAVSLAGERLQDFVRGMRDVSGVREVVGLSTCNRTEFYLAVDDSIAARTALLNRLAEGDHCGGGVAVEIETHSYTYRGEAAARHLFRVVAGIDSLVVGESEILGQVRRAFEVGLAAGSVGGTLNLLMSRAISFGRRVRETTNISRGNVSVASIAHRLVRQTQGDLSTKTLLVIGAGETARTAARHFRDEGIGTIYILNRTAAHSEALAGELGGRTLPLERLESGIELADIVVCAVGAPHHIITFEGVCDIMARRVERPLTLVDLSMPRNVDPAASHVDDVQLFSLDTLEAIAAENRAQRQEEIALVERLVEAETADFLRRTQSAGTGLLIKALRRRVEATRKEHLAKHGGAPGTKEMERLDLFSSSLLRSVLHDLTMNIRSIETDTEEGARAFNLVRQLFNIAPDDLNSD